MFNKNAILKVHEFSTKYQQILSGMWQILRFIIEILKAKNSTKMLKENFRVFGLLDISVHFKATVMKRV